MRAQTVDVKSSTGRVLCCTVFRPGGKKLLAKGPFISDEDVRVLESEGMESIWVTELEEGEVGEDDAVCAVASEMGCGSFEIRLAAGGRANLLATENCCVLVDDELLKQINCTASVVIATSLNFSYAVAGQRIATVKSAPFAVAKDQLEAVIGILKERGPILQARPVRDPECGSSLHRPDQRRARPPVVREHHAPAAGALRRQREFRSVLHGRRKLRRPLPATSAAVEAVRHSGGLHHRAGRSRRRHRPGHDCRSAAMWSGSWLRSNPAICSCWRTKMKCRSFPRRAASVRPSRMWWIWCCRRCWPAITSPVGKSPAWDTAACWLK